MTFKNKSAQGRVPIYAAKQLSERHGLSTIIVFGIDEAGGGFCVTTYGKTKKLCRHAADLSKKISSLVLAGAIAPAEHEPVELPDEPTQWTSAAAPPERAAREVDGG